MTIFEENRKLLDDFRSGKPEALSLVFRHYAPEINNILKFGFSFQSKGSTLRFKGYSNDFERQDKLQELFILAFKDNARMGYDGLRPYQPYLRTIVRNYIIDEFRKASREISCFAIESADMENSIDYQAQSWEETNEQSLTAPEKSELSRLLTQFDSLLTGSERKVFNSRFKEGKSQREAAIELDMSRMKIRTIEKCVRKKTWKFFKKTGYLDNMHASLELKLLMLFILGGRTS